jgi:hypothetical protein
MNYFQRNMVPAEIREVQIRGPNFFRCVYSAPYRLRALRPSAEAPALRDFEGFRQHAAHGPQKQHRIFRRKILDGQLLDRGKRHGAIMLFRRLAGSLRAPGLEPPWRIRDDAREPLTGQICEWTLRPVRGPVAGDLAIDGALPSARPGGKWGGALATNGRTHTH